MRDRLFIIAVLGWLLAAVAPDKSAGQGKVADGTWKGLSFIYLKAPESRLAPPGFGKKQREEVTNATWVIAGDKIKVKFKQVVAAKMDNDEIVIEMKDVVREMRFQLDLSKTPASIDLTPCAFPYTKILTGISKGIVKVEGNTLRICYGIPGTPRPRDFESAEGDSIYFMLFVLKRDEGKGKAEGKAQRP